MVKNECRYYVTYAFKNKNLNGTGSMYTTVVGKLNQTTIENLHKFISEEEKLEHVVILNIIKLEG